MKKDILISLSVMVLTVGIISLLTLQPNAARSDQYLIIFAPTSNHLQSHQKVIAAGGLPIRTGYFDNIILAKGNDEKFISTLKKNEYVIVLSSPVTGGCFTLKTTPISGKNKVI